ncbi:MAG: hypothetical protein CBD58_02160, partial [bacterium TMED198]
LIVISLLLSKYHWPTNSSKTLTTVFAEERPNRYHAGIDVRTYGKSGYPLFAIEDGYIERIRISTKGYGKAVYLRLKDGNVALYAHLEKFSPELEDAVAKLQSNLNSYSIDHSFGKNDFRYKRGETIGYTGDTGTISGPHLHFEIRNKDGQPINPMMEKGFEIEDNIAPVPTLISFLPYQPESTIDGEGIPKILNLQKRGKMYTSIDTLSIHNSFQIALSADDFIDGQPFSYGLYRIEVFIDDSLYYESKYDKLDFGFSKKIYNERNYQLHKITGSKFYNLFNSSANNKNKFVQKNIKSYLFNDDAFHKLVVVATDNNKNKSTVEMAFFSPKEPLKNTCNLDYEINQSDGSVLYIQIDSTVTPSFFLRNKYDYNKVLDPEIKSFGVNKKIIYGQNKVFTILEVVQRTNFGATISRTFHDLENNQFNHDNLRGLFDINSYHYGTVISFKENIFTGLDPFLSIKRKNKLYKHQLSRVNTNQLVSGPLGFNELEGTTEIAIHYNLSPELMIKKKINGQYLRSDKDFVLIHDTGHIYLSREKNRYNDESFVWIENTSVENVLESEKIIQGPYAIYPTTKKINGLNIALNLNDSSRPRHTGLFSFDSLKQRWSILNPRLGATSSRKLETSIDRGLIIAAIEDTDPPEVRVLSPGNGATYKAQDFNEIKFTIEDSFSGISGEENIELQLDRKPLIFEYNSYRKVVTCKVKKPLNPGKHELYLSYTDNLNNNKKTKVTFYIKDE